MKVIHVVPTMDETWGGPVTSLKQISIMLRRAGLDSKIVCTHNDISTSLSDDLVFSFPRNFPRRWFFSLAMMKKLSSILQAADIVHIHGLWTFPHIFSAYLCFRLKVPYIFRPCGNLEPWMFANKRIRKQLVFRLILRRLLKQARFIHAVSNMEKDNIRKFFPDSDIVSIPHFVPNREVDIPLQAKDTKQALFLSRFSPQKGLEYLIQAWEGLDQEGYLDNWKLIIAGDGAPGYVKKLKLLARNLVSKGRIKFTGYADEDLKRTLFTNSEFLIAPSNGENFGIAIVEAATHGLAIITTTKTPWEKIATLKAGYVIEPCVSQLKSAISDMIGCSPRERYLMGKRATKVFSDLTEGRIVQSYIEMYKRISTEKPGSLSDR